MLQILSSVTQKKSAKSGKFDIIVGYKMQKGVEHDSSVFFPWKKFEKQNRCQPFVFVAKNSAKLFHTLIPNYDEFFMTLTVTQLAIIAVTSNRDRQSRL
jgi:hypothetical protein